LFQNDEEIKEKDNHLVLSKCGPRNYDTGWIYTIFSFKRI